MPGISCMVDNFLIKFVPFRNNVLGGLCKSFSELSLPFIILSLDRDVNFLRFLRLRKFSFGFNRLEFTCDALIKYQAMTCGSTLLHILSFCKFDSPIWAESGLVLLGDSFRQSSVICQGRSHKWCEASLTDARRLPYL